MYVWLYRKVQTVSTNNIASFLPGNILKSIHSNRWIAVFYFWLLIFLHYLMTNDVVYLLGIHISSSSVNICLSLCLFLSVFILLLFNCKNSYILIQVLCQIHSCQIFSPHLWLVLTFFLTASFEEKFFNFRKLKFIIFFHNASFCILPKKPPMLGKIFMFFFFSYRRLIVALLCFASVYFRTGFLCVPWAKSWG